MTKETKDFIKIISFIFGFILFFLGWIPAILFKSFILWLILFVIGYILGSFGSVAMDEDTTIRKYSDFNPVDW